MSGGSFKFLQAKFIAVYVALGAVLFASIFADFKLATAKYASQRSVARVAKKVDALTNNTAAISAAERSITNTLEGQGCIVTRFQVESVKKLRATTAVTLKVTFTAPDAKSYTLRLLATEHTGAYTVDQVSRA